MAKVEIEIPDLKKTTQRKPSKKKEVRQIAKAKIKKPSIGKQFAESFINEDVENVKSYVIFDVIIPTIKDTILDMISMAFYSDTYTSRGRRRSNRGGYYSSNERTNYNSYYRSDRERSEKRTRRRRSSDVPEIIVDTRDDARDILDEMNNLIDEYDSCSVADLNDMVGIDSEHTDEKWGWKDLHNARIKRDRDGYLLDLPAPVALD